MYTGLTDTLYCCNRAIQAMDFYLHEVLGVANWNDVFGDLGVPSKDVQSETDIIIKIYDTTILPLTMSRGFAGFGKFCTEIPGTIIVRYIVHVTMVMCVVMVLLPLPL